MGNLKRLKTLRANSGFTLVELLVAVGVIGVLGALAIPLYKNYEARAKQAEVKTALGSAFTAEKTFHTQSLHYTACLGSHGYEPNSKYYTTGFSLLTINTIGPNCVQNMCGPLSPDQCVSECALRLSYLQGSTAPSPTGYCSDVPGSTFFSGTISADGGTPGRVDLPTTGSVDKDTFLVVAAGQIGVGFLDQWSIDQNKGLVNLGYGAAVNGGGAGGFGQ